jgi:hypothetical protein
VASAITLSEINRAALPLTFDAIDYDPLLDWIGNRPVVLMGKPRTGRTISIASAR